jgi:polysaccharide pyruvyl transferase WcaK-like protein
MLIRATDAAIDAAALRYALDYDRARYQPGKPLKLLFAGYSGMRNTGSDLRVEEMIRQLRAVLGEDNVELSLLTIEPQRSAGYFRAVRQLELPSLFPKFLFEQCTQHHGVVACEGSMFKSKFANALTTMMAGALGMANIEGKLSVGYGAEAGAMDPPLLDFVRRRCRQSLIVCRNEPSREQLSGLGIRALGGTDTAWTFDPAPRARGAALLEAHGWDGRRPVLVVCPINPFWWPVKPDFVKAAALAFGGQFRAEHYQSIYFHQWSDQLAARMDAYLSGLATAVDAFCQEHGAFVVVVGTEMLDREACERLAARLAAPAPVLVSDELDMYELVSVLRNGSLMVSSRFHAIVSSMPGGVPSIGVTMDERIHNLMHERGHQDLLFRVDDDDLDERLLAAMQRAFRDAERLRHEVMAFVPGQIRRMGEMGLAFADEVQRVYPEFPARDVPRSFEHYLPPLSADLQRLMGEVG